MAIKGWLNYFCSIYLIEVIELEFFIPTQLKVIRDPKSACAFSGTWEKAQDQKC